MNDIKKSFGFYQIREEALYPQEKLLDLKKSDKKQSIGIPNDCTDSETRLLLSPQGVNLLVESGHDIFMEEGAGRLASFTDNDYSEAGAVISKNKSEVLQCDIILKTKPPTVKDVALMKERTSIFSTFCITGFRKEAIKMMMGKKINAFALDFFMDEHECFPIVHSISEIEGIAAVITGAHYLSNSTGGKGVMLGGITGVSPTEVVVLGAGTAGTVATKAAMGMGAAVKVFDHSLYQLRDIAHNLGTQLFTSNLHPTVLAKALRTADMVIGTLRFLNGSSRYILSTELIQLMKPGSVIVDLSVDQGGCFETSKATTLKKPVFVEHGVIHHCLPSISVLYGRSATIAFSNVLSGLLLDISQYSDPLNFVKESKGFSKSCYLYRGILTNHFLGEHFDLPSKDISLLLAAF